MNWKIGRKDVTLLILAIVTRRYRMPLIGTVQAGTSNTKEHIALVKRYFGLFGSDGLKCLLADREFINL